MEEASTAPSSGAAGRQGNRFGAYRDESCTTLSAPARRVFNDYVEDSDPTDNKMEFIIRGQIDPMPKDAAYCLFSGIQSLCMQYQGEWVTMLDGMDIDLIVPMVGMGTITTSRARCGVNLNGGDSGGGEKPDHLAYQRQHGSGDPGRGGL